MKVRCIAAEAGCLGLGAEYTVLSTNRGYYYLEGVGGGWCPSRFEVVPEAPVMPPVSSLAPACVRKESNPKEAIGATKLNMAVVPSSALAYLASAFTEGALKYGSYNWRAAGVRASTYMSAHGRHVAKWWNGQNSDPATKVHHLANAMACLAIVLDAELCDMLTDDRPPAADMAGLIERLGGVTKHLAEMSKGLTPPQYTQKDHPRAIPA